MRPLRIKPLKRLRTLPLLKSLAAQARQPPVFLGVRGRRPTSGAIHHSQRYRRGTAQTHFCLSAAVNAFVSHAARRQAILFELYSTIALKIPEF